MPTRPGKAIWYAVLLWLIGFIWGSIVFMTPSLRKIQAIPYVSTNPAISFPILVIWLLVAYLLAKSYLQRVGSTPLEWLRLGFLFAGLNLLLDLLILVFLLKVGFRYFLSLTVWLGYFILLWVPWMTGLRLSSEEEV